MKVNVLLILMTFFVSSCYSEGIKFDPQFHINSSRLIGIIAEDGHYVSCTDDDFNLYASMHKDKIKELSEILKRARLPRELEKRKQFLLNLLEDVQGKMGKDGIPTSI